MTYIPCVQAFTSRHSLANHIAQLTRVVRSGNQYCRIHAVTRMFMLFFVNHKHIMHNKNTIKYLERLYEYMIDENTEIHPVNMIVYKHMLKTCSVVLNMYDKQTRTICNTSATLIQMTWLNMLKRKPEI